MTTAELIGLIQAADPTGEADVQVENPGAADPYSYALDYTPLRVSRTNTCVLIETS